MRPPLLALSALSALLVVSVAPASPASDYLGEVQRLLRQYDGPSPVDPAALARDAEAELARRCAADAACPVSVGREVAGALVKGYNDKHTNLRDPALARRSRAEMNGGSYRRVGVRLVPLPDKTAMIGFVRPDSPADRAGLGIGARITLIGGKEPTNANLAAAEDAGSVVLTVGGKDVALAPVDLPARDFPTARTVNDVPVLTIPTFLTDGTARGFFELLRGVDPRGPLVVDVRANGGGSLYECLLAASAFGTAEHELRSGSRSTRYAATNGQLKVNGRVWRALNATPAPRAERVVVLVSDRTASCGEVFASNLQRFGATIVGGTTAGVKNSAVGLYDLSDGSMLSVTTSKAFGNAGELLGAAVQPDRPVTTDPLALDAGRDPVLEAGLGVLRGVALR